MKNLIIVMILFISTFILSYAKEISVENPPLFATVAGVAEDDVLNIRKKPDHTSTQNFNKSYNVLGQISILDMNCATISALTYHYLLHGLKEASCCII